MLDFVNWTVDLKQTKFCKLRNEVKITSNFGGIELRCSILSERKKAIIFF